MDAEDEMTTATPNAAPADTGQDVDIEERIRKWRELDEQAYKTLRWQASALMRAFDGWPAIGNQEDWAKKYEEARDGYASGHFLLERIGAERYLDPDFLATLLSLRRQIIEDLGVRSTHEMMLVDVAVLSYYHLLRINGWIGNLALHIESEFFVRESPTAKFSKEYGRGAVEGLRVEDSIARLGEQLLPLLDRSSRMMIRALKAIRDLRQTPAPTVAIGQAGQVNVGTAQENRAVLGASLGTEPGTDPVP